MWFSVAPILRMKIEWGGGCAWDLSGSKHLKRSQSYLMQTIYWIKCSILLFFLSTATKGNMESYNVFWGMGKVRIAGEKILALL